MTRLRFSMFLLLSFCLMTVSQSLHAQSQEEDPAVTSKIKALLAKTYPTVPAGERKFFYNPVDLNDDGKSEYLVGLLGSDFCGSAGCTMLVLNSKFGINTKMTVVQFPVYVGPPASKEVTKGYSNLYVGAKGKGNVKMAWNGSKYPTNPSMAKSVPESVIQGKYAFLDESKAKVQEF
jgi:hypothetical protein